MGRSPCCSKDSGLNRGAWTAEEDLILSEFIRIHGDGGWRNLPRRAGLKRCGKSCRLRWLNYLRPDIKRGNISPDEEELIVRLHRLLGNRWSLIAGRLPGRTDNEIKNYWNTRLSKRQRPENQSPPRAPNNRTKSRSALRADDPVLKTAPVKATAVRVAKGSKNYLEESKSNHQNIRLNDTAETSKTSKCWSDLLVDEFFSGDDYEFFDFTMNEKIRESESSFIETNGHCPHSLADLIDRRLPHFLSSGENEVNTPQSLLYLYEFSSGECDQLSSPCGSHRNFGIEELEQICSLDGRNLQPNTASCLGR
uniref:Uncharacterized protein n=1 Tax=Araucaria cunninghamii TaxID=56994 RepID=A0A0D6R884_ARACU